MKRLAMFLFAVLVVGVLLAGTAPENTVAGCGPTGANGEPCSESVAPELL